MKWVNDSLKHHLVAQRDAIVRVPSRDEALPALVGEVIGEDTLWACTTCGYCEAACPIELEHLPRFFRMRQHRVLMDGEFPHELKAVFDAYEVAEQSLGTAGGHARRLGARPRRAGASTGARDDAQALDYLFYVGFGRVVRPARAEDRARLRRRSCRQAGVSFAILGARRDVHRRVRAPRRQRDAVPAARDDARRRR